jgi:hypothetical protein
MLKPTRWATCVKGIQSGQECFKNVCSTRPHEQIATILVGLLPMSALTQSHLPDLLGACLRFDTTPLKATLATLGDGLLAVFERL